MDVHQQDVLRVARQTRRQSERIARALGAVDADDEWSGIGDHAFKLVSSGVSELGGAQGASSGRLDYRVPSSCLAR